MKVFIVVIGSDGDLNPMLAMGLELQNRGHDVTLMGGSWQSRLAQEFGLPYVSILSQEQFDRFVQGVAHQKDAWLAFFKETVMPAVKPVYEFISKHYLPESTLLVGASHVLGLKLAHEKFNIPLLSTRLQPKLLNTFSPEGQQFFNDFFGNKLNIIRRKIGLTPLESEFYSWMMASKHTISFYPSWFAPAEKGSVNTAVAGFPFFSSQPGNTGDEQQYLLADKQEKPLVFTYGTGNSHTKHFFEMAAHVCEQLGKPTIFLTKNVDQLPVPIPKNVIHISYIALEQLLPCAELIIHHGGIGTCAQALRAGIPQVVIPIGFDQLQNASCIDRLGVGKQITIENLNVVGLVQSIEKLMRNNSVKARCQYFASTLNGEDAIQKACFFAEQIV